MQLNLPAASSHIHFLHFSYRSLIPHPPPVLFVSNPHSQQSLVRSIASEALLENLHDVQYLRMSVFTPISKISQPYKTT